MSGLITEESKSALVLKSSSLFVNVNGFVASTLARLCYFNQFEREVEAVFVYNDNETFIADFQATIAQRKVHTEIHGLLSERESEESCIRVQDQPDCALSIGKIPPNALVLLEVDVMGELHTTDDGQALVFKTPQVFTPFFGEFNESGVDICSAVQEYKFDLKIRTDMPCLQLAGCHSPTHAIQVDADADALSAETVIITLAEDFKYDKVIEVYFYPAKPLDVYTSIEADSLKTLHSSPKSGRSSMPSANPQTATELQSSLRNPFQNKESRTELFSKNVNPKAKCTEDLVYNKECIEVFNSVNKDSNKSFQSTKSDHDFHKEGTSDLPWQDSLSNTIHNKESQTKSFPRNSILNPKCIEVSIWNSMRQDPSTDFLNSATSESEMDFRKNGTSDLLIYDSKPTLEQVLRNEYYSKEHSSKLEDNMCHKDYFKEVNPTFYSTEDNANKNKDGKCSPSCQMDSSFDLVNKSTAVDFGFKEGDLNPTKLQDIYTSPGFLDKDPLTKNEIDHDYDFIDVLSYSSDTNKISVRKDPTVLEEYIEGNRKKITSLNDLMPMDSSENSTNVNRSSVKDDLRYISSSKDDPKLFQKNDTYDVPLEDTASKIRSGVDNTNICSTTQTRPRHFLSDAIIATSFLPDLSNYPACGEYIFMLDRSGSMTGSHICNAKESLVLFLKSLPASSYFNVVSFGSYSRSLFPNSQRYTQDSLEKACVYVNSIRADMGGSELLQPLKAVLEWPHKAGYARIVFVLTDGDVSQPDAILKYLKINCHKSRIFTFGIGPKISYNTVCRIARSAQGKAYFSTPGGKIQTKVIQCLKEVLKPTLCEIKVDWQLPTNWQLLRAPPEIPFAVSGQRINLYTSVQLPSRARKQSTLRLREKRKSSSVKEFWFDEELDSCQLGDNMFFDDVQDDGEHWGTDTDISRSCSDCEHQDNEECEVESDRNDAGNDRNDAGNDQNDAGNDQNDTGSNTHKIDGEMADSDNEQRNLKPGYELAEKHGNEFRIEFDRELSNESGTEFTETLETEGTKEIGNEFCRTNSTNPDSVRNWREIRNMRLYSSDTSTEDEGQPPESVKTLPEKDFLHRRYDINHNHYDTGTSHGGMETGDDVMNTDVTNTDVTSNDVMNSDDVLTGNGCDSLLESRHLSSNAQCNDVIHNDAKPNDVMHNYITDDGKQTYQSMPNDKNEMNATCTNIDREYGGIMSDFHMNSHANINNTRKRSKENVIDCDDTENILCENYQSSVLDDMKESQELCEVQLDKPHSDWACVQITGYIGPDIHRERIPLCLKSSMNAGNGVLLHKMAAKRFLDSLEAMLDSRNEGPGVEGEMVELSKQSRVPSRMTSSMTVDDTGNVIGVSQDSASLAVRRRHLLSRNSPNLLHREDYPPAILVSCPSVDEEPRSPTKRRLGASSVADNLSDNDGRYYHIERLDPEGCDQVTQRNESSLRHHRKRFVDCRNIPVKAIQRRKLVSTRLTLLTRKMRNAHKLNVFAGPPFIRLILLQSAEGFWQLTYAFARIIGLPLVQLELAAPFVDCTMIPLAEQDDQLGIDCYYDSLALWATALALVYLQRKWRSHEKDWELIASKSEAWLQRQTFPQGFGYIDVMLAARQAIVLLEQKYRSRAKSAPVVGLNQ